MPTKELQGKLWSAAPADWARYLEPTFIPMYEAALSQLRLNKMRMLLDAGYGSGLFLSMAGATGADVHGIDAAAGLLSISKKRLPDVTLLNEDLEDIPFGDNSFDVVTGFNSFQYAGSFENALAEARRVTQKKGTVVIGIWGREADCAAGAVLKAVGALLPTPPPGTPGPFALSEDGKVAAVCKSVGLKMISSQTVFCPWQFVGEEALHRAFLCTGPCVKAVQHAGEAAVKAAISTSAQPYCLAGDVYYLRNYFMVFITEKI